MPVHKHAALIHAYADGAEIEFRADEMEEWRDCPAPAWVDDCEYRVKSVAPEYPASTISVEVLRDAWVSADTMLPSPWSMPLARACADAAVLHEYRSGAAIPKAEHDAALIAELRKNVKRFQVEEMTYAHFKELHAARELAIAKAVRDRMYRQGGVAQHELLAVIASVP